MRGLHMENPPALVQGRDYYVDPDGLYVFTAAYLLARGTCCRSGCRHCPYGFRPESSSNEGIEDRTTPADGKPPD
jgi:hypothetical protein